MSGPIDYTALNKAVHTLRIIVVEMEKSPDNDIVRDTAIQRFEYTFELCWKFLRRKLEQLQQDDVEIRHASKKDLFRMGATSGLISDPERWFTYLSERNQTSHTYNEQVAESIAGHIPDFLQEAEFLLERLQHVD